MDSGTQKVKPLLRLSVTEKNGQELWRWHDEKNPEKRGAYGLKRREGYFVLYDGDMRHAVAPYEKRAFRFYREGIDKRRRRLTGRYLRDIVAIRRGDLVVNVGANVGDVATMVADMGAFVLAIEPDANVLPALHWNAWKRDIRVIEAAAWRSCGSEMLFVASESADSSLINMADKAERIETVTIDSLNLERVRLICGDAEGAEPEVLEGAKDTLRRTDYVSLCCSAERRGERTLEACEALLADAGFEIIYREDTGFCQLIAKNPSQT